MSRPGERNRLIHIRDNWRITNAYLSSYRSHVYSLFEELIHKPWGCPQWQPCVDILETEDAFIIRADLPGVEADSLNVEVQGRTLIIHGRRESPQDENILQTHLQERAEGEFVRAFEFEKELDEDQIERHWHNGVFILVVTKVKEDKKR